MLLTNATRSKVLVAFTILGRALATSSVCKCAPEDTCWPTDDELQALNRTVSGNLIRGVPPGSVCYPEQPNFDETACQFARDNWPQSTFHAQDPISVGWPQWAGNPCAPIFPNGTSVTGNPKAGEQGCGIGGYPPYALNATTNNVGHIQEVVRFAKSKNIRLNIKSTGHSFPGRSTAFGSISIWTHHLRGIQYHDNFVPASCSPASNTTQMAMTIAAGERVRDVYEAADRNNAIVVAGSAQDVGIVGWFTGGGHGPLSSTFGMGVDNVLQVQLVTTDGELIIANECTHPDLFWAIRGGGGGTFGVITEVVMKAYPASLSTTAMHTFDVSMTDPKNVDGFWDTAAYVHSELPRLKEGGLSGYYFVVGPPLSPIWTVSWNFLAFGKPNGTVEALAKQMTDRLDKMSESVRYSSTVTYSPSFFSHWNSTIGFEGVGSVGVTLGSRLLPASSLSTINSEQFARTMQNISALTPVVLGHMIANSANRDLNISLVPAWRDAVVHLIGARQAFSDPFTYEQAKAGYDVNTYELTAQLKSLAPESGAYLNEADPFDPSWQHSFFGANYPRLRSIKNTYDPESVLWCRSCVGSEDWTLDERERLCQVPWALSVA